MEESGVIWMIVDNNTYLIIPS